MRGEDSNASKVNPETTGSPPHARGRRIRVFEHFLPVRITPACAGKTAGSVDSVGGGPDHPRMRGEDNGPATHLIPLPGSPPHARGRQEISQLQVVEGRITPACAGKTERRNIDDLVQGDHPRMRGEDAPRWLSTDLRDGSPPHARGRHEDSTVDPIRRRITPACAGKTGGSTLAVNSAADHPRMRGEDRALASPIVYLVGSPPHARGRPRPSMRCTPAAGITPACAGKTRRGRGSSGHFPDHPRMRGEDVVEKGELGVDAGSPPHARGRRYGSLRCAQLWGITPACAGKTGPRGPKQPN